MGRIYLAAALLFPAKTDGASGEVDLRAHYWSIRRPFFLVLVPLMPIYTATTWTMPTISLRRSTSIESRSS